MRTSIGLVYMLRMKCFCLHLVIRIVRKKLENLSKMEAEEEYGTDSEAEEENATCSESGEQSEEVVIPRRSQRANNEVPPQRFKVTNINLITSEPERYEEMLRLPTDQQRKWKEAMLAEFKSLKEDNVFSPVKIT